MKKISHKPLSFVNFLFILILYELVLGGSGRFLEWGPLTFRMIFFLIAMGTATLYYLNKGSLNSIPFNLLIIYTGVLLFGSVVGLLNHASLELIANDLKPLIFFYIILFFSLFIQNIHDIQRIGDIIRKGSLILGIGYLIVIILLLSGELDFLSFYKSQSEFGEVMFRNETLFFYKGFLYLGIGFFFFLVKKGNTNKIKAIFLFICIILTLTRGFILFTIVTSVYYILFLNKKALLKIKFFFIGLAILVFTLPSFIEVIGDKSISDGSRYLQINEVVEQVDFVSFFIGHGFGVGVETRPIHMEIAFLEVFHKQGITGIIFWIGLLLYILLMYNKIKNESYKEMALPFILSVIFIFLESATNPFFNNPIGLTMILISILVVSKLVHLQKI